MTDISSPTWRSPSDLLGGRAGRLATDHAQSIDPRPVIPRALTLTLKFAGGTSWEKARRSAARLPTTTTSGSSPTS
ncbi:hypothetical protein ACFV83_22135 [Streptomyces pharetrae]|uniref:hypothetical protein n=1 Tax=Streptomyces pharetrae TaxID=291370 RepID=UPI00364CE31C